MHIATEEAAVRKNVRVEVPIERAFSIFVEQMESWWPTSHHIGARPFETILVEPRVGGRWYERDSEGQQCDWGTVLAWNPPYHVAFSWHLGPGHEETVWEYHADIARASQVDVNFKAEGPDATLVELVHSKLERHGKGDKQLHALFDGPGAWSEILTRYAEALRGREEK